MPAAQTPLAEAKRIYWFESAYDAMAYYQLNQKWDKELRKGVFVSTGGAPSQQQFKAMIKATPRAYHHLCFDQDRAGQIFAINFALTQAGKTFTSNVTKDDKLLVRISGEENQNYEIKLEPSTSQDNRHAFTSQRNLSGRWYARLSDNRRRIFAGDEHGVPRRVRDSPCRGFGQ